MGHEFPTLHALAHAAPLSGLPFSLAQSPNPSSCFNTQHHPFFSEAFSHLSFVSSHYPCRFLLAFVTPYYNYMLVFFAPWLAHHELSQHQRHVLFLLASPALVWCLEHHMHMIHICGSLQTFMHTIETGRVPGKQATPGGLCPVAGLVMVSEIRSSCCTKSSR